MTELSKRDVHFLRACYALSLGTEIAPKTIRQIVFSLETPPEKVDELLKTLKSSSLPVSERLERCWYGFDKMYERHLDSQVEMLHIRDARYPASLRAILDPPPILYLRGSLGVLSKLPGIAIVGTREATENGATIAFRLAAYLASNGWTVVSGLARGIDASAHQGALSVGAPNVAVLAHGLERASPAQNKAIADDILLHGGAWVSEHPIGQRPRPAFFVQRNRIQTGLSAGSVIVEGAVKSGTMTQADFCVREHRALFAVIPSDAKNSLGLRSDGPNYLVQQKKAIPIRSKDDYGSLLDVAGKTRASLLAHTATAGQAV